MIKDAKISSCGLYRYSLWRSWDQEGGILCLIMLNPSTADAAKDDPTVSAAIKFAQRWGFGSLIIGNLFAWRSSSPKNLRDAVEAQVGVGIDNDGELTDMFLNADEVAVGWGSEGRRYAARVRKVHGMILTYHGRPPKCVGTTNTGDPKHWLLRFHTAKQKAEAALVPWVVND